MRAAALALVLVAATAARADDPQRRWHTIETEHFRIHYYMFPDGRGEEPVAQRLAVIAEESHRRLVPLLGPGLSLSRKTEVLLTDETDDFNGSAGVQPYPSIRIWATSPDDRSELNDYDDWLTGLFLHEYTHILHIGTIGGWCAPIVNVALGLGLGIVYAPNQVQPRFIIEGLAVFEESERASGGRLRNAIWDMVLRAQTLEGRFQTIGQFSNSPIQFPFANSPYLYGSAFVKYVASRFGQDKLQAMSRDYGSNCIPFAFNRSLKRVTGKTWNDLYGDFKAELTRRYRAQRDAIRARGLTETRHLTPFRERVQRPTWTPDGKWILFADSDMYTRPQIRRVRPDGTGLATELRVDGAGGPSLSADGRTMVFHAVEPWRTVYFYNDLYAVDRETQRKTRLTDGMRATNPAISPDGTRVVFEYNDGSSRGIALLERATGKVDVLVSAVGFEHAYTPVFSPDGKTIAFSWWRQRGYRDIWTLDLETRARVRVTADRAVDMEPRFSPDGKWLYFVSDRSGVHNLYAQERASGILWQASNVVNGVFDPAISPDGKQVAFVGFVADGYDLQIADLDASRWWLAQPALLDRPEYPPLEDEPPRTPRRYNPLRTALPWTPALYSLPDGYGQIIGLRIAGGDIVGRHAWGLNLGFGTGRADDVNFSFNYSYRGLWPSLNLGVSRGLLRKRGLVAAGQALDYDEDTWSTGASVTLPIVRRLVSFADLSFSYNYAYSRNLTPVPAPDPSATLPVLPEVGPLAGLAVNFAFSNTRRFLRSVSTEEGRDISLSLGIGSRYLGSRYEVYTVSWRWGEHIPMPWKPRLLRGHVLLLQYAGGLSGGDLRRRGFFFLGGYPPQDLLTSIYDFSRPGAASLRGYPYASVVGDQFHVLNAEYRFPIAWIERSIYKTVPIYFRRLHGRAFVDYGGAFTGGFSFDKLKVGAGAELMLEVQYFYYLPAALQLGYAHGFSEGGGNQVYFLLNAPF